MIILRNHDVIDNSGNFGLYELRPSRNIMSAFHSLVSTQYDTNNNTVYLARKVQAV